jgi:hypothetical protein
MSTLPAGTSPYDNLPVQDGVGYHDPDATELDDYEQDQA